MKLIKVSVDDNNNKFWEISHDGNNATRKWGRVGAKGSSKTEQLFLHQVEKLVDKKINEGYIPVKNLENTSLSDINNQDQLRAFMLEIAKNDKEILNILEYCLESNIHTILEKTTIKFDEKSGLFKTPLGFVTKNAVNEANELLESIYKIVKNKDKNEYNNDNKLKDYVNKYLSLIPQKVGLKVDINLLFGTEDKYNVQKEILDALLSSLDMVVDEKISNLNNIQNPFDITLEKIKDKQEIKVIKDNFKNNQDSSHPSSALIFKNAYKLDIKKMSNQANFKAIDKNVKRLWHGTRVGNLLSIFKNGMQIISSKNNIVTGRMFGDGLYFSDTSTKALNYSLGTWNGVGKGSLNKYYALLCDVYMGNVFEVNNSSKKYPVEGYDSTFAKKGVKGLRNNEMIVYNSNQVIPIYLIEFEF